MGRQLKPTHMQHGAVLVVALIFLIVMTVAGITAVRFSTIEERMASNVQFRNQTFQLALSELRSQLLALNQNLANRAPLLVAMSQPAEATTADIMKILPDGSLKPYELSQKMPNNIALSQARMTGVPGICTDSANTGSSADIETGFKCLEFELSAVAALGTCPKLPGNQPDYACIEKSANSSQGMGISFVNN